MKVSEAVNQRMSVRAFKSDPVPGSIVREILEVARRSPSGGNLQPWRVFALAGKPLAEFKAVIATKLAAGETETPVYDVYPPSLWEPFKTRRRDTGARRYAALGVDDKDKAALKELGERNYRFFDAPVGLFFCLDRRLGPPQWSDMGMYMQTVMLLAAERGLDTCPQESWSNWPVSVRGFLCMADDLMLFAGMSMGYRDVNHPLNKIRTAREPFETFAEMRGFD
ncbi:MAG: nitroreductase family protein [Rhodospirillales bacterium]|nr:nitroreductase family protein [Rhodospirillales bacterium]